MHVRLVEFTDSDGIVRLGRLYAAEAAAALPHVEFDEPTVRQTVISAVLEAHPTIFVIEHKGAIIGLAAAGIHNFYFMAGHFVQVDIIYVHPDFRGTRAAALLLVELKTWADQIGAKVSFAGNANNLNTDRTARFLKRFGFQIAGLSMLRPKGA